MGIWLKLRMIAQLIAKLKFISQRMAIMKDLELEAFKS